MNAAVLTAYRVSLSRCTAVDIEQALSPFDGRLTFNIHHAKTGNHATVALWHAWRRYRRQLAKVSLCRRRYAKNGPSSGTRSDFRKNCQRIFRRHHRRHASGGGLQSLPTPAEAIEQQQAMLCHARLKRTVHSAGNDAPNLMDALPMPNAILPSDHRPGRSGLRTRRACRYW